MSALFKLMNSIRRSLFPMLEEEIGPLSEKYQEFVRAAELADLGQFVGPYGSKLRGRKREERVCIALAFVAKAIWNIPTTGALLDRLRVDRMLQRLCGWEHAMEIPSESTFSRAFAEFALGEFPQRVHGAMVKAHQGEKLVGHVSRDATAIEGREKPVRKEPAAPKAQKKRGRPRRGEIRPPKPQRRVQLQPQRSLEENLADLPRRCDVGCKLNSKGHPMYWIGYKLHLDWSDAGVPVSALLSSASLHDSQAAIPLAQMSEERVKYCYELMDAAYDVSEIRAFSQSRGHVALIDANARSGEKIPMDPARIERFKQRSTAERGNSDLKDNYGGRFVYVRGAAKVMAHLSFGLIALAAARLFGMVPT